MPHRIGGGVSEGGCNDGSMDRTGNLKNVALFYFLLLEITIYSVVRRYCEMGLFRSAGLFRSYTNFITAIAQRTKIVKLNHLYQNYIQTDHI